MTPGYDAGRLLTGLKVHASSYTYMFATSSKTRPAAGSETTGVGQVNPRTPVGSGSLRIIGGEYRGRRLPIPILPGLRPTPDRIRETLFNWLAPVIAGAHCLDLYAGSGALGFEAISRGAARVVMVERAPQAVRILRDNAQRLVLGSPQVEIFLGEALDWLAKSSEAFDMVFLDPPFAANLLGKTCLALASSGRLGPGARIYLETGAGTGMPTLPEGWRLTRTKQAGQVRYGLAETG